MVKNIKLEITVDPITYNDKCNDLHEYCENISNKISEYVESKNIEIPQVLLDRYIYVVCNNIFCWTVDYNRNIKFINYIFKNCKVDPVRIINTIKENPELIEILIKNNKDIDMKFFQKIPTSDDLFLKYIERFIKNLNCTEKTLEVIFNTAVERKFFKSINKILDMKFHITDSNIFDNVIFGLIASIVDVETILKKCINNGAMIQKDTLKIFINKLEKSNYYQYQCSNFISIVTFLYTNGSTVFIDDILKIKSKVSVGDLNVTINHINDLNQIEITRDEFKRLCESSIKLTNFKNVIKYFDDTEIKSIIYSNKISYPIEFEFDINILRNECKKTDNINGIKKILKVVKPDQICMENACSTMNINLIKLLRENYNIPINEKCIYNSAKSFGYNRIVTLLVKEYEKENNINAQDVIDDDEYFSDEYFSD
jgi:hypothetical protein